MTFLKKNSKEKGWDIGTCLKTVKLFDDIMKHGVVLEKIKLPYK